MVLNVVTFLWGHWPDPKSPDLGLEYVEKLARGVARNLSCAHRFICFTEETERTWRLGDIEFRPLGAPSWKGCLPKLYAYAPDAGLRGRTLVFDLDNIITGRLDRMAAYDGDLAVRAWFGGWPKERVADGDMIGFDAGSETARRLWRDAMSDVAALEETTGGRERWFLRRYAPDLWQDILGSRAILSYKRHLRGERSLPEGCSIVSCHDGGGKQPATCRPHQLSEPWVRQHWR